MGNILLISLLQLGLYVNHMTLLEVRIDNSLCHCSLSSPFNPDFSSSNDCLCGNLMVVYTLHDM